MKEYKIVINYGDGYGWEEYEGGFKTFNAAKDAMNYEQSFAARSVSFKIQSREIKDWVDETV